MEFSQDGLFAAVAQLGEKIATVLDLESDVPWFIIDTDVEIYGLGIVGNTIVVAGDKKIVAWNLPAGNSAVDVMTSMNNSVQTTMYTPDLGLSPTISVSPNLNCIAIIKQNPCYLNIYGISNGKHLVGIKVEGHVPWFTPDGQQIWYCGSGNDGQARGWADRKSVV